jgi:chromosome segregation ATPase
MISLNPDNYYSSSRFRSPSGACDGKEGQCKGSMRLLMSPTLAQIDREVEKKGISRAQWLSSTVGAYLRLLELSKGADPAEMAQELAQLRITNDSQWRESQKLKKAEEAAREEAEQTKRKLSASEERLASALAELEKARTDMILFEHDKAHYLDTIKQRDQQILFLEAHIAQLVQSISQLSLKPGEEEIKKKGWWRFWK